MKLIAILRESLNDAANERIDALPQGKLFPDAKRIDGVFKRSSRSWSEVIEALEQNKESGEKTVVNTNDVHITQPNVQSRKVKEMIENPKKIKTIDVVQFPDWEMVIPDGHHSLTANWALGKESIEVNLIKAQEK